MEIGKTTKPEPNHYLESGERSFLPEVILSIRTELIDELDENTKPIGIKAVNVEFCSLF